MPPIPTDSVPVPPRPVFEFTGDKFVIPAEMTMEEAVSALQRQIAEDNVNVNISEEIPAFPLDGAVALTRVLARRYGWLNLVPTPGFFRDRPPDMIGVEVGVNQTVQVPWGRMSVPKIDGFISTGFTYRDEMPVFCIVGTVKRKDERVVAAIAKEVREEVRTNSIYRRQAVKINFRTADGTRIEEFHPTFGPRFIDLKAGSAAAPVYSKTVEDALETNVLTPIRQTDMCRNLGAALKKGILLAGHYGVGKTLLAFHAARVCVENGWTFLYVQDVRDLDLAYGFARLYEPCLLFAEDCDRITGGDRSADTDRLLNVLDGVESKGADALITVLTTNNLRVIHPAFLRPGRIDAVIEITPPDAEACARILERYAADGKWDLAGSRDQFAEAVRPLVGANAAFMRNVVEQAKLAAIRRGIDGRPVLTPTDVATVTAGLVPHALLINPNHGKTQLAVNEDGVPIDPLTAGGRALVNALAAGVVNHVKDPNTLAQLLQGKEMIAIS